MRLLSLRFKNLNSLEGEWEIDFTHPNYGGQGLFAITGPTGAGKSTLLDAISLALYGRTPRLDRISASQNEIMSRHTGECFAEVCFETQAGQFRVHWAQHRARKQAQGELQNPRHEIAKAKCGTVLAHQLRRVATEVERITGMDFERFTRSMLLAQGNFAAFLQADADQRAPILEQITGTEIYSDISIRAHERYSLENQRLQHLEQALEHIELLPPDQEAALSQELTVTQETLIELTQRLEHSRTQKKHFEELQVQLNSLKHVKQKTVELHEQQHRFSEQNQLLLQAKKAALLEKEHYKLDAKRSTLQDLIRQQKALESKLPIVQSQEKQQLLLMQQKQEEAQAAYQNWQTCRPILQKARELDAELQRQQPLLIQKKQRYQIIESDYTTKCEQLTQLQANLSEQGVALNEIQHYLEQNQTHAGLVEQLSAIEQRYADFIELEHQHAQKKEQLQTLSQQHSAHSLQVANHNEHMAKQKPLLDQAKHSIEQLRDSLTQKTQQHSLQRSYELIQQLKEEQHFIQVQLDFYSQQTHFEQQYAELVQRAHENETLQQAQKIELGQLQPLLEQQKNQCDTLERLLAAEQRVQDLEQERTRLKHGAPCPLCGSTVHPYAVEPLNDLQQTHSDLTQAQQRYRELVEQEQNVHVYLVRLGEQFNAVSNQKHQLSQTIQHHKTQFMQRFGLATLDKNSPCLNNLKSKEQSVSQQLKVAEHQLQELTELQNKIHISQSQYDLELQKQAVLEQKLQLLNHEGGALEQSIHHAEVDLEQKAKRLHELKAHVLTQCARYADVSTMTLAQLLPFLAQQQQAWLQSQQKRNLIQQEIQQIENSVAKTMLICSQLKEDLEERRKAVTLLEEQLQHLIQTRTQLLPLTQQPIEVEQQLEQLYKSNQVSHQAKQLEWQKSSLATQQLLGDLQQNQESLNTTKTELNELDQHFNQQLLQLLFTDEAHYLESLLTAQQIEELQQQKNTLEQKAKHYQTQTTELEHKIQQLQTELGSASYENLLTTLIQQQEHYANLLLQQGRIQETLSSNQTKKQHAQEQLHAIEQQRRELQKWAQLRELIGSADGKKFRNFAQGLTFDRMVQQANQQLRAMQDRYLLLRDPLEPLVLNVVDNYQAGEIRSTKNLSGGESFLISLALALGLSRMASQNVRIDSLFLDEGFGTLDEEALDVAIDTLASLQQDGKLIGVISHVPALKERIHNQIQVLPISGGRSRLIGPGCQQRT